MSILHAVKMVNANQGASGCHTNSYVTAASFMLLGVLKILYAFRLRIDSDETQHLHVVWSWTQGLLPYRDTFDNHSPLFQFLCAPYFALMGEHSNVVSPMRLLVVPLYFLTLWCTYRLGRRLWSRSVGLSAAILCGAYPIFFVKSSEFRPDDLWAPLWLLSILALTARPFRNRHAFLGGLAMGACFITTMKTSALALSLGGAGAALLVCRIFRCEKPRSSQIVAPLGLFISATGILPLVVVIFFAAHHALPQLYYGAIVHNLTPALFKPQYACRFGMMAPMAAVAILGGACAWRWRNVDRDLVLFLGLTTLLYLSLIMFIWPLVEPHDALPIIPIVALFFIPLTYEIANTFGRSALAWWQRIGIPIAGLLELGILFVAYSPLQNEMKDKLSFIDNVLRLTTRNDFVMDAKGESIFRRRPFFYVLEGITLRRMELGLLADDIPARLIETTTPIATTLRMPPRACDFIEENYLPVAFRLRVLGKELGLRPNDSDPSAYKIDIVIPARYTIVAQRATIAATIDGTPLAGGRYLEPGPHDVTVSSGNGEIELIWADAIEKGFSPFSPRASDFPGASD